MSLLLSVKNTRKSKNAMFVQVKPKPTRNGNHVMLIGGERASSRIFSQNDFFEWQLLQFCVRCSMKGVGHGFGEKADREITTNAEVAVDGET